MLIPIGPAGDWLDFAGFPFREMFVGHGVEEFFRDS